MQAQRSLPVPPLPLKTGLNWGNISLLALVHVVAIGGMAVYVPLHGLPWSTVVIAAVLTVLTIFSISAGYHRLFSHRAYESHPALRLFLLAFGAGSFQNSALVWAVDHRRHHARVDSDVDPYDVRRGFWYAHIGWVLRQADPTLKPLPVKDLERDPLVSWQHRRYAFIGIAMGVGLPVLLGWAFGDPWGGFIVGGAVRLFIVYHVTFAINSFAHTFGTQPFCDENSSRDSLLTALVSMGEGYHNFHHTFPADYRNGVYAHQFDPTKWILWACAGVGLARDLRRTPDAAIVRARLRVDERLIAGYELQPAAQERLLVLRTAVDGAAARWHDLVAQCEAKKQEASAQARDVLVRRRADLRRAAYDLRAAYASWQQYMNAMLLSAGPHGPSVG
jgi:stearoyl-CoA desaturase (delta-9 desaturase)